MVYQRKMLRNYNIPCHRNYSGQHNQCGFLGHLDNVFNTLSKCILIKMVSVFFLSLTFLPFSFQNFQWQIRGFQVFILNFGENKISSLDCKVGCNTVEYTMDSLYSDWLYFHSML